MTFISKDIERYQLAAADRMFRSEIYRSKLRRALINGWDKRVLTDFLVLDNAALYLLLTSSGTPEWKVKIGVRKIAFQNCLDSALKKLDVRVHVQAKKLQKVLLESKWNITATDVLEAVYGKT